MSLFWSQWMGKYWNADVVRWLKEDWHVTLIRAAMAVSKGGYVENPDVEMAKLEAVVDACIEVGIYVVIDWHDYHADDRVEDAKAFFERVARKYGDKPNVLFETFNEPQQISWEDQIEPYHEQVVEVIRRHSDNVIILGTRTWSQEVDVASSDPVPGKNLAYTIHFYAASMGQDLRDKVSTALNNGVAIFATEWGTCEYTGDGNVDLGSSQAWLDFLDENHISDANWAVSDKAEACSALREGASESGHWSEGELTESGAFVRNSIRKYNSDAALTGAQLSKALVRKDSVRGRLRGAEGTSWGASAPPPLICLVSLAAAAVSVRWLRSADRSGQTLRRFILLEALDSPSTASPAKCGDSMLPEGQPARAL
jgi:endoglucanase